MKLELEVTPKQLMAIAKIMEERPTVIEDERDHQPLPTAALTTVDDHDLYEGDTVTVSGFTGPEADAINGEHKITNENTPPPPPTEEQLGAAGQAFQQAVTAATPPPPPPAAVDVKLAKGQNGKQIPWDARIHGKAKKTNADGTWRLIQGVNRDTTVPTVETDLVEALAMAALSATDGDVKEVVAPFLTPAEPPASTVVPSTFAELLPLVTAAKAAGTLTDEQITATCKELGLAQFGLIATRPDLIPQAAELLGV